MDTIKENLGLVFGPNTSDALASQVWNDYVESLKDGNNWKAFGALMSMHSEDKDALVNKLSEYIEDSKAEEIESFDVEIGELVLGSKMDDELTGEIGAGWNDYCGAIQEMIRSID